jgi:hypothetical protein
MRPLWIVIGQLREGLLSTCVGNKHAACRIYRDSVAPWCQVLYNEVTFESGVVNGPPERRHLEVFVRMFVILMRIRRTQGLSHSNRECSSWKPRVKSVIDLFTPMYNAFWYKTLGIDTLSPDTIMEKASVI